MKVILVCIVLVTLAACAAFSQGLHGGGPPITTDPTQLVQWGLGSLIALATGGAAVGAGATHVYHRYIKADGSVVEVEEEGVTDKDGNVVITTKEPANAPPKPPSSTPTG